MNEFYETEGFKEVRTQGDNIFNVLAKYCKNNHLAILFFSPLIYKYPDPTIRIFIFLHELMHGLNESRLEKPPPKNYSTDQYYFTLYWLFDEYSADRLAYNIIQHTALDKSELWKVYLESEVVGFSTVLVDVKNYTHIREEMDIFRYRTNDINLFFENIRQSVNDLSVTTIHLFFLLHHYPDFSSKCDLSQSRFINKKTKALLNYLRDKFENGEVDLSDGLNVVTQNMTIFGYLITEIETGPYCTVLDI